MPSLTIDATVLTVPAPSASKMEARSYVQNLLDWRQLLDDPWMPIYMSGRTAEALADAGMYPLRQDLKQLFASAGIDEYDFNTVATVAELLLRLTPTFEQHFAIEDLLYEDAGLVPDVRVDCPLPSLANALERCILMVALLRSCCTPPILDHTLVMRLAPMTDHSPSRVHVKALIHDVEHQRTDLAPWPKPPDYLSADVAICDSFRSLLLSLDDEGMWDQATVMPELVVALRIYIYKLRLELGQEPDWGETPRLRIGASFRNRERDVIKNEPISMLAKVMRAIAEAHEGLNPRTEHELRVSDSGGAALRVRKRDGAKAYRRDIDRDHHLHYWRCTGNVIELSWLSYPHDDFTCPE